MEITEVRIKLMEDSEDRLRAFCSITLDQSFVVRDLKIIEGSNGPFVAMPSRKLTSRCQRCGHKNYLRSQYCSQCGVRLRNNYENREDEGGPNKLYADVAHPINQLCRDMIQEAVVREYLLELDRAKQPGYKSRYDEAYEPSEGASRVPRDAAPHFEISGNQSPIDSVSGDQLPVVDGSPITDTVSAPENRSTENRSTENRPAAGSHSAVPRPHMLDRPDNHASSQPSTSGGDSDKFGAGIF